MNSALSSPLPRTKLELIQVFRGLAALIVVCYHTGTMCALNLDYLVFNNAFKLGHTGVTFFFVLSGFIIYYIHHRDIATGKGRFVHFLKKRIIRIYPLYWLIFLLKILAKPISLKLFLISFFLIPVNGSAFITVSWTLSFEIFFYLLFGLLILDTTFFSRYFVAAYITVLLSAFGWLMFNSFTSFTLPEANFLLSPFILQFLLGVLAARLYLNNTFARYRRGLLISGIALYLLFSVLATISVNSLGVRVSANAYSFAETISSFYEIYSPVFFGLPSMLIVWGASMIDRYDGVKIPNILLKLGDASFSIYLVHGIFLNIVIVKLAKMNLDKAVLPYIILPLILIALFIGGIVHFWAEKPLTNYLNKKFVK